MDTFTLCDSCATERPHMQPLDMVSVDGCDLCADKRAGHHVYEALDTCPARGEDRCFCTTEQRRLAEIQADVDWAIAQTAEDVARIRTRDTTPLAGYTSGWTR